jgi:hypothetical protein
MTSQADILKQFNAPLDNKPTKSKKDLEENKLYLIVGAKEVKANNNGVISRTLLIEGEEFKVFYDIEVSNPKALVGMYFKKRSLGKATKLELVAGRYSESEV